MLRQSGPEKNGNLTDPITLGGKRVSVPFPGPLGSLLGVSPGMKRVPETLIIQMRHRLRFGVRSACEVFLGQGEGELLEFDAVAENPFDPTLQVGLAMQAGEKGRPRGQVAGN